MQTMRLNLWKVALPVFAIGMLTAAWIPSTSSGQTSSPHAGLPAEAARMYACVTKPHPGELKWQKIPWLTDLSEAIRVAEAEKRPLLLFVSGDEPLGKC
jgi:hypothetical protein